MPYIPKLDRHIEEATNSGELNFLLTKACKNYIDDKGLSYQTINDILGALEGAKLEFTERVVRDYEDRKIRENSDVYAGTSSSNNLAWAGGFFEGEGCFYAHFYKPRKDGSRVFRMAASLTQKDKRLLDEFKNVVKMGVVYGPNEKGVHTWISNGNEESKKLFYLLRPWLGERRQSKALELIEKENKQIFRPLKETCKRGHKYTKSNTTIRVQNNKKSRRCKDCQKEDNGKR